MQQIVPLTLPKNVPVQPVRRPQANIPQSKQERDQLAVAVRRYVEEREPVPPLSREELESHTDRVIQFTRSKAIYRDYLAVLISNEVWRETLATIPYERRLLLLPKCLRVEDKCPAPFDEFGLLCKQCGLCTIQDLQVEAERLGYAVLVAEGSAVVMAIVETGKIDAIVGVSCLSVLERAFPYMEAAAVPGIAIPLLQDDCRDTTVDLDWVWNVIHLSGDDRTRRLDLDALRDEVQSWFEPRALEEMLGPVESDTEEIARAWLAKSGKRWRPFLTACAFQSFQEDPQLQIPADLQKIALSVECFHKASLVHDDIEDRDSSRYGEATLHEAHGVPVALNVGDLLLGEGYRMIAESQASPKGRNRCYGRPPRATAACVSGRARSCGGTASQNPSPRSRCWRSFAARRHPPLKWLCVWVPFTLARTRRSGTRFGGIAKHWALPTRSEMIWPMQSPTGQSPHRRRKWVLRFCCRSLTRRLEKKRKRSPGPSGLRSYVEPRPPRPLPNSVRS